MGRAAGLLSKLRTLDAALEAKRRAVDPYYGMDPARARYLRDAAAALHRAAIARDQNAYELFLEIEEWFVFGPEISSTATTTQAAKTYMEVAK